VPLAYASMMYGLRHHIGLVREGLQKQAAISDQICGLRKYRPRCEDD